MMKLLSISLIVLFLILIFYIWNYKQQIIPVIPTDTHITTNVPTTLTTTPIITTLPIPCPTNTPIITSKDPYRVEFKDVNNETINIDKSFNYSTFDITLESNQECYISLNYTYSLSDCTTQTNCVSDVPITIEKGWYESVPPTTFNNFFIYGDGKLTGALIITPIN